MEYSVVIPVYNSQDSLGEIYTRISSTLKKLTDDFEIIFVDDYSKDESWNKLIQIKKTDKERVKIIRFSKNYGQHNATFCGFKYVLGKYIITIDDDLQNAPEDILLLIDKIRSSNLDLVYGIDYTTNNSSLRKAGSTIWKKGSRQMEGALGEGSSFRIFNSALLKNILNHNPHFIYLDELLFWYTNFIEFVAIERTKRVYGNTGYSPFKLLKFIASTTFSYGTWPLKLMTYGGIFFSLLSFGIGLFFLFKKFFLNVNVAGFTAVIVAISFSTSLILLCFGVIGKYLSNIYVVLNNKPTYSIKELEL